MQHLCDANVWIALSLENHKFRETVLRWYDTLAPTDTLLFCRATQQSYLRLLTQRVFAGDEVRTNNQAIAAYQAFWESPLVAWVEEPASIEDLWLKNAGLASVSPKIWMDAYLAAFAVLTGSRLVTFDKGFRVYKHLDWIDLNQN